MNKYLTAYKNSISTFFQYRLNLGLLLISHAVSLSGLVYLWIAIYASGQSLGDYTLTSLLVYYIVLTVLRITISNGVGMGFEVSDEINQGVITNYLLKPFSYTLERLAKLLGGATVNIVFISPVVAVLAFLSRETIALPSAIQWLQFIGMSLIGLLFYFLVYYLAALSSFWVHRGGNFIYGTLLVSGLLNGSLLPLDLFPEWYQPISQMLPFQFLIFIPIQTFLGRIADWNTTLITAAAWIAILSLLILVAWKRGIRKFEAVGR
jgi:ABC-2 type transport system permease protein